MSLTSYGISSRHPQTQFQEHTLKDSKIEIMGSPIGPITQKSTSYHYKAAPFPSSAATHEHIELAISPLISHTLHKTE